MSKLGLAVFALGLLSGCAHQSYSPRVDYIGAYRDSESTNDAAANISEREAADVEVLLNQLPQGVTLKGEQIEIAPDSPWILVAEATADPNGGKRYWFTGFYDYNEDESWRKGLCYWQVPLHWVTLGLWWIMPTDYACNVMEGGSVTAVNDRKRRVIRTLQRAAKATKADLVVLTAEKQTHLVSAPTGKVLATMEWDGGKGYLFRKKTQ